MTWLSLLLRLHIQSRLTSFRFILVSGDVSEDGDLERDDVSCVFLDVLSIITLINDQHLPILSLFELFNDKIPL